MRIGLMLVLLAATPCIAQAALVEEEMGPYSVSFSMNTSANYSITGDGLFNGSTTSGLEYSRYNISVNGSGGIIHLVLTRYYINNTKDIDINSTNMNIISGTLLAAKCTMAKLYQLPIDGHPGYLGACRLSSDELRVCASYFLDGSEDTGQKYRTNCRIFSTYPWEVIRDMLATLHVEEQP